MPYKVSGKRVLHYKNGKWRVKQVTRSKQAARRALALLRGIEHGWKPTGKKSKRKYARPGSSHSGRRYFLA